MSGPRGTRARTVDGVELSVTEWTERSRGEQVSVVFLHGMCLDHRTWHDHAARAAEDTPAHVITYDHRGHGESGEADPDTYRVDVLAADLDAVLDETVPPGRPLVLVGHSLGGMVALEYVTGRHSRSADVKGLVLCATSGGGLSEWGAGRLLGTPATLVASAISRWVPGRIVKSVAHAVTAVFKWRDPYMVDHHPLAAAVLNAIETASPRTAAGFLSGLSSYDCRGRLGSLDTSVRIISGGMDCLTPPVHAMTLATLIPQALHLHFPEAGHMIPQTRGEDVAAAVEVAVTNVLDSLSMVAGRLRVFLAG